MYREIKVQRISTGSVFKLVGVGFGLSIVPFSLVMGVLALFGSATVNWNNQPVVGIAGLLASPFIGLFLTGLFTMLFGSAIALGLWLYSRARPIRLVVKVAAEATVA